MMLARTLDDPSVFEEAARNLPNRYRQSGKPTITSMQISTLKIVAVAAILSGCLCLTNLMVDDAPPLTYHTLKVDGLDIFYRRLLGNFRWGLRPRYGTHPTCDIFFSTVILVTTKDSQYSRKRHSVDKSLFCFPARPIAEKEALTIRDPNYVPQRKMFQRL
jgi:hypothetical protein